MTICLVAAAFLALFVIVLVVIVDDDDNPVNKKETKLILNISYLNFPFDTEDKAF